MNDRWRETYDNWKLMTPEEESGLYLNEEDEETEPEEEPEESHGKSEGTDETTGKRGRQETKDERQEEIDSDPIPF